MKRKRGLYTGLASSAAVLAIIAMSTVSGHASPAQVALVVHHHVAPGHNILAQEEAQGGDCVLTVPADPLTAQGLATPYQLSNGPNTNDCTMANAANLGAFVEATIIEPGGAVFGYSPLVVTQGTTPAAPPPVPSIPAGSVITIDTAFAGNILFLQGPGAGVFNQGLPGSPFGQVAFANGPAFFAAARAAGVTVPPLGTARDGMPCPTVRDFSLVDQDPSDNVNTLYVLTADGLTAEQGSGVAGSLVGVGSDNHLLTGFVDPALGCLPFAVPSLSNPGTSAPTQATDELQAGATANPALVPTNDPMTTVGADIDIIPNDFPNQDNLSDAKTNLYRSGVGQPRLRGSKVQDAVRYCRGLAAAGPRVRADAALEVGLPSLAPGTDLATFMLNRYAASLVLLNCKRFS